MSSAADEITAALNDVTVEARLRGGDVEFAVNEIEHPTTAPVPADSSKPETSDDVARITLRLPESIKNSVEQAARSGNISVNGWLVGAIDAALGDGLDQRHTHRRGGRSRGFTGFARS